MWVVAVAAGVGPDAEDAEASLRGVLAAALEANREMARLLGELREENAGLREQNAGLREQNAGLREQNAAREAELEGLRADLTVLQRLLFGQKSEKSRPEPAAGGEDDAAGGGGGGAGGEGGKGGRGGGCGGR